MTHESESGQYEGAGESLFRGAASVHGVDIVPVAPGERDPSPGVEGDREKR